MLDSNKIRSASSDQRKVAILTATNGDLGKMVREILRTVGVVEITIFQTAEQVIESVETFASNLVIVDDSQINPAPVVLRSFIQNPICAITPVLVLGNESQKQDETILSNVGRPFTIHKPLTPAKLSSAYKTLNKVWSSGIFKDIGEAIEHYRLSEVDKAIQTLLHLNRDKNAQALAAPSIAAVFRKSNNPKQAEKILLSALKASSRDSGVHLALADLYIHNAMPATAKRVLENLKKLYGPTLTTVLDELQVNLMTQDLDACITNAKELVARSIYADGFRETLVKLLYAAGEFDEFKKYSTKNLTIDHFDSAWKQTPTKKAG